MSADPNPTLKLILGRRSVRVYSPGEIGDDALKALLQAAMAAPSAMSKDPWRFVVVRQTEMLGKLSKALPGGSMLPSAALAIVVCGDLDVAFECNTAYLLQDCSACIENLLLCAHGLGLGACWVGIHPGEEATRQVKALLHLPGPVLPIAALALGYPGEQLEARTRYNAAYVHREQW